MSGNTKAIHDAVTGNTYDFSEAVDKKLKEKVAAAIKDEETKVDMDEEKSPLEESGGQILRMLQGMRKTVKDIDRMLTRTRLEKKERMEITNQLWQLRNELGLVEESLDEGISESLFMKDLSESRISDKAKDMLKALKIHGKHTTEDIIELIKDIANIPSEFVYHVKRDIKDFRNRR